MSNTQYRMLYVRNIANQAKHEEIRHLFSKYGSIYDITVPLDYYTGRMKGYAFIHFNHSSDAKEAHKRLDGTEFLGRVIEIEFARGQRRTPAEMMRMEGLDGGRNGRDKDRSGHRSRSRSGSRDRRSRGSPGRRRSPSDKRKSDSSSKDKKSSSTSRRRKSPSSSSKSPRGSRRDDIRSRKESRSRSR